MAGCGRNGLRDRSSSVQACNRAGERGGLLVDQLLLERLRRDPDPASGIIAFFDAFAKQHPSLEQVVRAASSMAGCGIILQLGADEPALRCADDRVYHMKQPISVVDAGPTLRFGSRSEYSLALERGTAPQDSDELLLERVADVVVGIVERTRRGPQNRPSAHQDLLEVLFDDQAADEVRSRAARMLGLRGSAARAVCLTGGRSDLLAEEAQLPSGTRAGVGPQVEISDLPRSWRAARLAFLFTGEGTPADPAPRVEYADDLGTALGLASLVEMDAQPPDDVLLLDRVASAAPWVRETLWRIAMSGSQREAAGALHVHHSTLQTRLVRLEELLGWNVVDPGGRTRLVLALQYRQILANGGASKVPADHTRPAVIPPSTTNSAPLE